MNWNLIVKNALRAPLLSLEKTFYGLSSLCLQLRFWQVNWVKKNQILRCAPKISQQISTHKTLVTCQNQQKTFVCVWQSKIVRKKLNTWNSTPSHHKNTHGIFSSIVLLLYFAIFIISILLLFLISNTQLIHFSKAQLAASTWRSRFGRPTKVDPRVSEVVGGSYCKMPEDWLQKRIGMKKQTNKRKSFEKVLYFPHRHHIRRSCTLPFCLFSQTRKSINTHIPSVSNILLRSNDPHPLAPHWISDLKQLPRHIALGNSSEQLAS